MIVDSHTILQTNSKTFIMPTYYNNVSMLEILLFYFFKILSRMNRQYLSKMRKNVRHHHPNHTCKDQKDPEYLGGILL